jgi:hypothetical protein
MDTVKLPLPLLALILFSLFVNSCSATRPAEKEIGSPAAENLKSKSFQTINPRFLGNWVSKESSAVFKIREIDGEFSIDAWDGDDGELFKVSAISWSEQRLKAVIVMPSTQYKIQIELAVVDKDELECFYSGDRFGKAIWYRRSVDVY